MATRAFSSLSRLSCVVSRPSHALFTRPAPWARLYSQTNTNTNGNTAQTQTPSDGDKPAAAAGDAAAPSTSNVDQEKIAQLETKLKDKQDELMLALADRENTRRIAKKDVADAKVYGVQSFAKALLDVEDNFSRALESVPKDLLATTPALKALYDGVVMTEKGFMKILTEQGVTKLNPIGEKFDPNRHMALFEVPDSSKEAGIVSSVIKEGFILKDRVLRPASVGVYRPAPQS
eukprot:TRINITY_DN904_c0_g1_i1.p1 TRINITY_DN904_c0_g1~~TRINITY_DN904_c0_g1_i1.p1  ORF type:complete len:247 (+),score=66.68 TRINITY_DN904_c0_g1_i1:44-742(+)